jgi:pyrroloquinoline-quinone synthase
MATMHVRAELEAGVARALEDRQLLAHPFYLRWEAGRLQPGELAAYAEQYRHFEAAVPSLLRDVLAATDDEVAAGLVRLNLADEESNPMPHIELFERFADGVGAVRGAPATAATAELLRTYAGLAGAGSVPGLAAMVAYETQAPAIAASKASGLRRHYACEESTTSFWDVHATMDLDHGDWGIDALEAMDADPGEVFVSARRAADAWWAFLDEREAARPVE